MSLSFVLVHCGEEVSSEFNLSILISISLGPWCIKSHDLSFVNLVFQDGVARLLRLFRTCAQWIGIYFECSPLHLLGDQPEPGCGVPVPWPVSGEPRGLGGLPPGHLPPCGAQGHQRSWHPRQAKQSLHQVGMFGQDLSIVNLVSLVVCLLGISLHVECKATSAPNILAMQNSCYMRWERLVMTCLWWTW